MALIIKKLLDFYRTAMEEWKDPRADDYFLMSSAVPVILIVIGYLYFVLDYGPKMMKNRPPYNIDKLLIAYNIIQVIYCAYIVIVLAMVVMPKYNILCEPIDYSNSKEGYYVLTHVWLFFFLKVIDLLDTVFFVLRKKDVQVSFLHVYHHAGMVFLGWISVKFVGGGSGVFVGGINSLIHTFMYFYYLLTVWNKSYKQSVWWKKHITHLQLIQFALVFLLFVAILLQPNCTYPKWPAILLIPQNLFMFSLFGDFYYRTYIKAKKK